VRSLWYLPLTFLAGVHGFAIFAPYLAVVFAALHLRSRRRARLAAAAPVAAPAPADIPDAAPVLLPVPA
jgi:hypothetical protein